MPRKGRVYVPKSAPRKPRYFDLLHNSLPTVSTYADGSELLAFGTPLTSASLSKKVFDRLKREGQPSRLFLDICQLFQFSHQISLLPRQILYAKVTLHSCLAIDRTAQLQLLDDAAGSQIAGFPQ